MSIRNKIIVSCLVVAMMAGLAACGGSSASKQEAAETTTVQTTAEETTAEETTAEETTAEETTAEETTAEETTAEETTAEETTTEAETEAPGPYSDSAAFEGFDAYVRGIVVGGDGYNASHENEIRLGETTFRDIPYASIDRTGQSKDDTHESIENPETLEPGAAGKIVSAGWTKLGGQTIYRVFNPTDEPAAFEDCMIVGVQDEEVVTFSNRISIGGGLSAFEQLEAIKAVLGEPNAVKGEVRDDYIDATFFWRDENDDHLLKLALKAEGDYSEVRTMAYYNYALMKQ